ncbi:hypothetical protein JCM14076_17830 [Methylosoma difficile]
MFNKHPFGIINLTKALLASACLLACTSSPEFIKRQKEQIKLAYLPVDFGFKFASLNNLNPTLTITDFDGSIIKMAWSFSEPDLEKLTAFRTCLEERPVKKKHLGESLRQTANECAIETRMPKTLESKYPNEKGFFVLVSVLNNTVKSSPEIPIYQSGSEGQLGGRIEVNRPSSRLDTNQLAKDGDHCLDQALAGRLVQSYSGQPSGQGNFEIIHSLQSIEPFMERYTECFKSLGYAASYQ